MDTDIKKKLAHFGDTDAVSSGQRVKGARQTAKLSQAALGEKLNVSKQAISNVESGVSFPTRDLMIYFSEEHGIDPSFILLGHYRTLGGDIQSVLFEKLAHLVEKKS